jgi:hypothetical protein
VGLDLSFKPRSRPPGLADSRRSARRSADVRALIVLVGLPVLIFGIAALLGHPILPGDDLTQNYPLRVLAGRQLASGTLPLLDPYIWSGAPLLAGWNAGAAYPLTLLFAFLPGSAAWTLNLMVTWAVAAAGMFWFLRALRLSSLPAALGAASFAFAGAMTAQVGHFGLVAGLSWVPLELLCVLRLSEVRSLPSRLSWIGGLAAAFGLTILAGEPRAIANAGIVVLLYAVWRIIRLGRRGAGAAAVSMAAALLLGAGIGAVQWMPGLASVATSQRSGSLALFSSGSLSPRWLLLMLVPDLLGGSGSFGQPAFFASYNLAEVTSYVGILPVVGALALLGRLRLRQRPPEWLIWHLVALAGIVLALGARTPVGHLLADIPLYGGQRLQSRNLMVVDLALAILLAYWLDGFLGDARRRPSPARGRWRPDAETLLGVLPAVAMIAVVVIALSFGTDLLHWLGVTRTAGGTDGRLKPWLIPYALIGAGAIALVLAGRRLPKHLRSRLVAGFVAVDIVVFTVLGVVAVRTRTGSGVIPAAVHKGTAAQKRAVAARTGTAGRVRPIADLGYGGRFAIYDPANLDGAAVRTLGSPDLNVLTATPSVQGYSSTVAGFYASATGAHRATGDGQNVLSPKAVGDGTLDQLDTSVLLTLPQYLLTGSGEPGATAGPAGSGSRTIAAGHSAVWYFGRSVDVTSVRVPDSAARKDAAGGIQIGLVSAAGPTRWYRARADGHSLLTIRLPHPAASVAVVVRAGRLPTRLGPPAMRSAGRPKDVFVADGELQNALVPPRWGFAGLDGAFAIFTDRDARAALTITALPGRSASGASVRQVAGSAAEPAAAAVSSRHGVRIVRSVAAIPGWTAVWHPRRGPPVTLTVRRSGLVQAVDVPAGSGIVTWTYVTPGFAGGLAVSAAALAVLAALLAAPWIVRRRRRATASDGRSEAEAAALAGSAVS